MTFDVEDLRALADIGFIAMSRGLNVEAAKIFEAVRLLRPEQDAGFIGAALVDLRLGKAESAIALLRKPPPSDAVRLFLGLALINFGERREGIDILEDVSRHGGDEPVGRLARSLLDAQRVEARG